MYSKVKISNHLYKKVSFNVSSRISRELMNTICICRIVGHKRIECKIYAYVLYFVTFINVLN